MKAKGKAQIYNKRTGKDIGQIKVLDVREADTVEIDLQMEDNVYNEFVYFGRKDATRDDFFSIAFKKMLAETIQDLNKNKKRRRND
jgi:hypothetical protein